MNISAVVLAGGVASRMGDITRCIPKSMLLFHNRPFIEYVVRWLQRHQINQIILSVGHLSEKIYNHFNENEFNSIEFVQQPPILEETGGAIAQAAHYVIHDNFFVLNGDTIFSFSIDEALRLHYSKQLPVTQVASRFSNQNVGAIQVDQNNSLVLSSQESDCDDDKTMVNGGDLSSSGVYLINTEFARNNFSRKRASFEKNVLPALIKQQMVAAYVENNTIYDFGTPERFEEAQKLNINEYYSLKG